MILEIKLCRICYVPDLMLETTSLRAWRRTVLSTGSTNHGFTRGFPVKPASIPTRPREVIPYELRRMGVSLDSQHMHWTSAAHTGTR